MAKTMVVVEDTNKGMVRSVGIDENFPYAFPGLRGLELLVAPGGACDPSQGQLRARLSPFRHGLGAFVGTVAAVGGDIVIPAGSVVLFANGNASATTGLGAGTLTDADTNSENDGGVAKGSSNFIMEGIGVAPVEPWFAAAGAVPGAAINLPQWLRDLDADYSSAAMRAVFDAASMEITNGDDACDYDLGPLALWGQMSGVGRVRNGIGGIPGALWFMATPQVSGSSKSSEELTVTVRLQRAITLPSSPLAPTQIGQVVIPFRVVLVGYPQCPTGAMENALARKVMEQDAKLADLTRRLEASGK